MSPIKEFDNLRIPLQAIKLATNNFSNCIGHGGFGNVYEGKLLQSGQEVMVAVKRLDRTYGQGDLQFWKEIMMLSGYKHENLVSLLGFSDEDGERILVYEHLHNGSLDKYLSNNELSWIDRLRICIGIARGLEYLHNPRATMQRVLHCDIKSSNILLDANWDAKISDFGLSKFVPANKKLSFTFSASSGTPGYCDPLYRDTGFLSKETDIYSFGVVLLEVLCGMSTLNHHPSAFARYCYEEKEIPSCCLDKLSTLIYQCFHQDRNQRPQIAKIVKQLKAILRCQIIHDTWKGGIWKENKLKPRSQTVFHLIENREMRIFVERRWSNMKELKSLYRPFLKQEVV